jgi:hypothetical protein
MTDLSDELENALREDRFSLQDTNEGDIFRQYRIADLEGDEPRKKTLLAKLSNNKRTEISKLRTRAQTNGSVRALCDALDALIPFNGLWPAFQLGNLDGLLRQRCYEVRDHKDS